MQYFRQWSAVALFVAASFQTAFAQDSKYQWKQSTENGYTYKYVTNDPTAARFYTLKNGLTVILSPDHKKPRIQTCIVTKAGSKNDPSDHTGLAHYLEHLLFKGTDKYGTLNWAKEKPLLDQIDKLYAQYNSTTDETKRKEIYKEIDRVSGEASKYAIPNEYDKMMSAMGAEGTNALTSFEKTIYVEDIPANTVDKYLAVQAERFRNPVLRLFHTELEAVYEEKNRTLDNDGWQVSEVMMAALFSHHNYGQHTNIGTIEHLKNPSLKAIREFYATYYVPNNMAVIMSGDFDPEVMIRKIDQTFSYMQAKLVPEYKFTREEDINIPITREVYGPAAEKVIISFRMPGANAREIQVLELLDLITGNGQAGIIDLDLVQSQQVLDASCNASLYKDYSYFALGGLPKEGQTLEEVKILLLAQMEKLRKGQFTEAQMSAAVNNAKKSAIESNETLDSRVNKLTNSFVTEQDWKAEVSYETEQMEKITKQDIVDFANKYLKDNNYVIVYKRKGEQQNVVKVEKPPITPITLNKETSPFVQSVNRMPENTIKPVWINYTTGISRGKLGPAEILSVQNKDNSLFRMYYHYDIGQWNNKLLPIATGYLEYLGTKDKSRESFSKQFYQLASSFTVATESEETYIVLKGLNENFDTSVALLEDLLKNCVADETAWTEYKSRMRKVRADAKENKDNILIGLRVYAQYGSNNPFNNVLSDAELDKLTAKDMVDMLHKMINYKHRILYYGPKSVSQLQTILKPLHSLPVIFTPIPAAATFKELSTSQNQVLFANYDMTQAEIFWFRSSERYNVSKEPTISLFNNYFGGNMGSIVFQTIRESKALAYSTYAYFGTPSKKEENSSVGAYVGTQADKINEAIPAMNELLNALPESRDALENAKLSLSKSLASERITKDGILFNYLAAQKLGNRTDIRKNIYEALPKLTFKDLQQFHKTELSHKPYTYCIVGSEQKLDLKALARYGAVKKLTLQEIFGY